MAGEDPITKVRKAGLTERTAHLKPMRGLARADMHNGGELWEEVPPADAFLQLLVTGSHEYFDANQHSPWHADIFRVLEEHDLVGRGVVSVFPLRGNRKGWVRIRALDKVALQAAIRGFTRKSIRVRGEPRPIPSATTRGKVRKLAVRQHIKNKMRERGDA